MSTQSTPAVPVRKPTKARSRAKLSTFEVDKAGLAKLLERRGKEWVVAELVQNGLDQNVTKVEISLTPEGEGFYRLIVEDDDPDGFADITHAYTLFADSGKKGDATKRGRFNLGEKLVIALCKTATIYTTKATIRFTEDGREMLPSERKRGSVFDGIVPMTAEEYDTTVRFVSTLLVPNDVRVTFNGDVMAPREPICEFEMTLRTERSDAEGVLRPTTRKGTVRVYATLPGETAHLYELGIPVVVTGDTYHVDVAQKVPLNTDRDNVPPSFLRDVRAGVLNHTHEMLTREQASEGWVADALADALIEDDAVRGVVATRFGERAVINDPTDREGTHMAVSQGYNVVPGSALPRDAWDAVRRVEALLPAGRVTPSPQPYGDAENGGPRTFMEYAHAPLAVKQAVDLTVDLARVVLGADITVRLANDPQWRFNATYGPLARGTQGQFTYNIGALGFRFFDLDAAAKVDRWLRLVIHEFAHHKADNHLSREFYDACCEYGAIMARVLATDSALCERVYGATVMPA